MCDNQNLHIKPVSHRFPRESSLNSFQIIRTKIANSRGIARIIRLPTILIVALILRIGYVGGYGHTDISIWSRWIGLIQQYGLFNFYAQHDPANNYPPLAMVGFGVAAAFPWLGPAYPDRYDANYLTNLKVLPVLCDLLIIVVVYRWLRGSGRMAWIIPGLLAVAPGPILVSAWWGQLESQYMLFAVLAVIALNRRQPLWAWVWFSLGILVKPQVALLTPLLIVLTLRRHGLISVLVGVVASLIIGVTVYAPFVYASGLVDTLSPYTNALNVYPVVTMNAFNLWYVLSPHHDVLPWPTESIADSQAVVGNVSYKEIGLFMAGLYVLVVCIVAWKHFDQGREFVWAAALYFGVFMLPTQVHERYLYPAPIFLIIALAQDRRLWPVVLGTMYTFAYNITWVVPVNMNLLWPPEIAGPVAYLNIVMLLALTCCVVFTKPAESRIYLDQPTRAM